MADESGGYEALYARVMVSLAESFPEERARELIIVGQLFRMLGVPARCITKLVEVREEFQKLFHKDNVTLARMLEVMIDMEHMGYFVPDPDIPV